MVKKVYLVAILFLFPVAILLSQVERIEEGNLVMENIPVIPEQLKERMIQYQNIRSAGLSDWNRAGEGIFIRTRFGETSQLHFVKGPGGARRQMTFFDGPIGGAVICPDPDNNVLLFTKDVGGSEFYQIFSLNLENGEYNLITDGKSRNGGISWSNKGDRFAYFSTKRNGQDWDLYIRNADGSGEKIILQKGGTWYPAGWSPDDSRIMVTNYISANESFVYVLDIESGAIQQINPGKEKIAYQSAEWASDGKKIYYTSDEEGEYIKLRIYDLNTHKSRLLSGEIPWNIEGIDLNKKGDILAFVANEGGINRIYFMNTKDYSYKPAENIPVGQISGLLFHPEDNRLAFSLNTAQTPGDIYTLDAETEKLERWTYSEVGGLNTNQFVNPTLIHFETFDKVEGKPRKIPAFYYKPNKGEASYPVVIYIHGGPESQYTPYFSSTMQYIVNELGIAVLAPNVRGSDGYGKSYLQLDNGYLRENSVKDIGKLIDWIEKQDELNKEKIAVYGGSYGGYMVLASMTHFNDRLACGIDVVGISNFVTFLENTQDYRRDLRRVEYGDERDPEMKEFLEKISPLNNVHKITKPLFVIQGLNDPRVPASEAEQIVDAVRSNGGDVWYLLAKDEGHGFRKKKNRDFYQNAVMLFLEKHLLE